MANLHKTERKLPWLVRDGGLPSDWLRGRIGGNSLQLQLETLWHIRRRSSTPTRIY